MPRYLVTSALPYANGPIHFGHVIGAYLPADVYVRYRRMRGDDVLFVCGTDEHGVAITINAEAQGVPYREFVDKWHKVIGDTLRAFEIDFENDACRVDADGTEHAERFAWFGGTSRSAPHARISQRFFKNLDANRYLAKKTEKQWFCVKDSMFLADRYLEGTCPFCGAPGARGDECKKCGQWIDALQLKDPRCKLCGTTPEVRETTHWHLDLPKLHEDGIAKWFAGEDPARPHVEWKPNVRAFVANMLAELKPRPITRDLRWGVPVPVDGADGKVLYVWFDAPIGYCSFTQEILEERGRREAKSVGPDAWLDWWAPKLDDPVRLVHFIGKDNIGFHTIVFPSMLLGQRDAFGRAMTLPWAVPAMEFYNLQGRKFSTSDGWTIDPLEFLKRYPNVDAIRFTLLSTAPETADSEFTWEDFLRVNNRDLADNIGNLLSRVLKLAMVQFGYKKWRPLTSPPPELAREVGKGALDWSLALNGMQFRLAINRALAIGDAANRYFDANAPWKLALTDPAKGGEVVYWTLWCLNVLGTLLEPFMPTASQRVRKALGVELRPDSLYELPLEEAYQNRASGLIDLKEPNKLFQLPSLDAFKVEFNLSDSPPLFQKLDEKAIAAEVESLRARAAKAAESKPPMTEAPKPPAPATTPSSTPAPAPAAAAPADPNAPKPTITYDDFAKVEFRTGTVTLAEKVANADKLLRVEVDLGKEKRQVVAGIAAKYAPEQLVGKRVVVVCNLASRKMRGVESHGMILAADDGSGPVVVSPLSDVANGATVK